MFTGFEYFLHICMCENTTTNHSIITTNTNTTITTTTCITIATTIATIVYC